ncbi:MAG: hypothetical protein COV36_07380 [Alphaproteobacteria bacterium CG11_big_fil_rev_8_21_14_0_20_44_7]|nr:MAG: hypothetical protein COV36_07380 [Alphaproteobacteria bacterium CG11_big_fil_rev_8_21_14_0_20_44_7]
MKKSLFTALSLIAFTLPANAQNIDSAHGDWTVFNDGGNTCYIASTPIAQDGNYTKRGQPYVLVNHKSGGADEINISSGYPYKKDVDVEVKIDKQKYRLFTQGEHAWAKDSITDTKIVNDVQAGSKMIVKGISRKGTYSIDTYSLKGSGAAYKRMKELCN